MNNRFLQKMQGLSPSKNSLAIEVETKHAQKTRVILEKVGIWDRNRRLGKGSQNCRICIPLISSTTQPVLQSELKKIIPFSFDLIQRELPLSKVAKLQSPYTRLVQVVIEFLRETNIPEENINELLKELPHSWEHHGDLVLFPRHAFTSQTWKNIGEDIWPNLSQVLSCQRLARKTDVIKDDFRTPRVEILLGDDGWVDHVDNGITYSYDITRCMFSAGNITEKVRIAKLDCKNEVIVDLYAGIGYFTIPYLVHAGAAHVHACEWNPHAVQALQRNLKLNGVSSKATVYEGDNRQVCPKDIADRVNLGLIPSSEQGWPVACAALKRKNGGTLHIHENVSSYKNDVRDSYIPVETFRDEIAQGPSEKEDTSLKNKAVPPGVGMNCDNTTCDNAPPCGKLTKPHSASLKPQWLTWSEYCRSKISELLREIWSTSWEVKILHIEHVKSYAPHVDHIVLDLLCRPLEKTE